MAYVKPIKARLKCQSCEQVFERRFEYIESYIVQAKGQNLCKDCQAKYLRKERCKNSRIEPSGKFDDQGRPLFTIDCQYCNNPFLVIFSRRSAIFCSKKCQVSSKKLATVKNNCICKECGFEFSAYGNRFLCSDVCISSYFSKIRLGENNPAFIKEKDIITTCRECGKIFTYTRGGIRKGTKKFFCDKNCFSKFQKHSNKEKLNSPEVTAYTKYTGFNAALKRKIRERDKYTCCLCGDVSNKNETFDVHHIDYDIDNPDESNLITLCRRCHNWTNKNRLFWQNVFSAIRSGSKIVNKGWGLESHIVNNNDYCLKYLIFFEGKKFSFHLHGLGGKNELFHCLQGKFICRLQKDGIEEKFLIKAGDKVEIKAGTIHQLEALKNSIIIEVSTRDFIEDSHRVESGDSQK